MVKKKGVSLIVDENFFKTFEVERQKEQAILRQKFGGVFNLTQRNFTAMLSAKNFKFQIPKQKPLTRIRVRKRRRLR